MVGRTYQEAAAQFEERGLTPVPAEEVSAVEAPRTVLRTDPGAGTLVTLGSGVTVVVAVADLGGGEETPDAPPS